MGRPRRAIIREQDEQGPTPETLAKLRQPVWQTFIPELQEAAVDLRRAFKLGIQAGRLGVDGYERRDPAYSPDWTTEQKRCWHRYKAWRREMVAREGRQYISYIVQVLGVEPMPEGREPDVYEGPLKWALRRWCDANRPKRLTRRKI